MERGMKKKILGGLFWRFAERICAQGVSLIISIILARLLSPRDYGAISMVMIFITIANVFVDSGFANALVQKKDADSIDFSTVFYFNMVFSIVLYLIIFLGAPFIAKFYNMQELSSVLRVLGIQILISGFKSAQISYVQKNMLFKRFFWSTLGGTICSGAIGVFLAYHGCGIWALVAQYLSNSAVDTIVLWFTVNWRPTWQFSFGRLKSLFGYGWKLLIWSLMSTFYENLRSLIIGKKYSSEDLAFYTKGKQWPNLIITNVNTSISSVLFPALSQYQDDKIKLKEMTRKSISISSYIIAPMLMGMAGLSTPIITLLLTDKWLEAVPYMWICSFYLMFMPMQTANLEAIKAMGRSDLILKMDFIKKIMQIGCLLISMHFGVQAIASSAILTTLFACVVNAWPNQRLMGYRYREQMQDLLPNLGIACIMGMVVYGVARATDAYISSLGIIIFGIVVGIFVYVLLSVSTRNKSFKYLLDIVQGRFKQH